MSRPFQVALLAAVALAAVWFVALRPKDGGGASTPSAAPSAPKAPAPAQQSPANGPGKSLPGGLGRAVGKTRGAAGQSAATNQRLQQATGAQGAASATAPPVTRAPARPSAPAPVRTASAPGAAGAVTAVARAAAVLAADVPVPGARRPDPTPGTTSSTARVTSAIAHGRTVVLLFWSARGADDRLVRGELAHVSDHGGRVLIVAAPIGQVSRFGTVTRGVQVLQSPTILVVNRARQAQVLTGYTDRAEIGQAVGDALAGR